MFKQKSFWLGALIGVLAFVVISTTLFSTALYRYNWDGPVVKSIVKVLPYSAMKVNRYSYSYYDYLDDLDGLKFFMKANPDVVISAEEMKISSLQTALDSLLLEELAARYDVKLVDEDYDEAMKMFLGVEEITEDDLVNFGEWLSDTYGWDLETYKNKVIRLLVLSEKVSAELVTDLNIEGNRIAKESMDDVYAELGNGSDFAELAKIYSEDGSGETGGDLGWFTADVMVEEFVEKVETMEVGTYSEVFPSRYGYHIVKLNDKRVNEETGLTEYNAAHIIVLGTDLDTYLFDARSDADIDIKISDILVEDFLYNEVY